MTTNEIAFDSLRAEETVVLETANSAYVFSVTDAANRVGVLTGGVLGDRPMRASLLGSVNVRETYRAEDAGKVKVGARAIFLYRAAGGERHLVTSPIVRLTHTKPPPA